MFISNTFTFFVDQDLGFEEMQSVLLLEKFLTVPAVLASFSDAARGKITCVHQCYIVAFIVCL